MTSLLFSHLLLPFVIAMFLAITMGGSGTAPSFSVAYGANLIRKNLIPGLFGLMLCAGAIVAGNNTSVTIGRDILPSEMMTYGLVSIILLSVTISLLFANIVGIPQSTSQSTILAVTAPALYYNTLNTSKLFIDIIPTWFVLPLISFAVCFLIGKYIYNPIRRRGYFMSAKTHNHPILQVLVVAMSLYVAFSIGANNVANAAGPIASMTLNRSEEHTSELQSRPHHVC